jgi:DNA-binding response OmpR family regulator
MGTWRIWLGGGVEAMITVDQSKMTIQIKDAPAVRLGRADFRLLLYLASRPGHVRTRDQILEALHGNDAEAFTDRSIDSLVKRLRRIVGAETIETIYGIGYAWSETAPVIFVGVSA